MVEACLLDVKPEQVQELAHARDHHPKASLRVTAAAILKVASGVSMREVAHHGLLKPVDEETVSRWVKTYQQQGLTRLQVHPGRGRKPAFSPSGTRRRARRARQAASGRAFAPRSSFA